MKIGLMGAHRVGKTTLMREVEKSSGMDSLPTNASGALTDAGFDPRGISTFVERMRAQELILDHLEATYMNGPASFITDRTPMDVLMYLYDDIRPNGPDTEKTHKRFAKLIGRCMEVLNDQLDMIVVVHPGIPLVEESGKAIANRLYQERLTLILTGLLNRFDPAILPVTMGIDPNCLELAERTQAVLHGINQYSLVQKEALDAVVH